MRSYKAIITILIFTLVLTLFPFSAFAAPPAPTLSLAEDTGISNDNITSNGQINISGIESNASWEYSINSGTSWNTGSGTSFVLDDGTYNSNMIHVRQTVEGVTSASGTNASTIVVAGNQIENGDFQSLYAGFTSDYTYYMNDPIRPGTCESESTYAVVTYAKQVHNGFTFTYDHTYRNSNGKYFVANGSLVPGLTVWQSTSPITVEAGTAYRFEANLMSLTSDSIGYPKVKFQLGDGTNWVDLGTTDVSWTTGEVGIWHTIFTDGKFNQTGTYYIRLLNSQTNQFNDLGVDDIYFGLRGSAPSASEPWTNPTTEPTTFDTSSLLSLSLASDTGYSSTDNITSNGQVNVTGLDYAWQYSTNNGSSWTNGSGSSFTLSSAGANSVIVRQQNGSGVWQASSAPLEFYLDSTAPTLSSATVDNNKLTLNYNENLDSDNLPTVGDFSIVIDGETPISTSNVNISESSVILTLPSSVYNGQNVSVNYTAPSGDQAIRDIAGNKSSNLTSQAITNNTITITYDDNGAISGSVPSPQNKVSGVDLTLATNSGSLTYTEGYHFSVWNTQSDGKGADYAEGGKYSKNTSATLYAKWTGNTYTVTFDAEGGSVTPSTQDKQFSSTYGKASDGVSDQSLPIPTKTGYTFDGWWTGDNGTDTEVTDTTTMFTASNHTLYAKWVANAYTVTFDAEGGSVSPASQNKLYNSTYGKASDGVSDQSSAYSYKNWVYIRRMVDWR